MAVFTDDGEIELNGEQSAEIFMAIYSYAKRYRQMGVVAFFNFWNIKCMWIGSPICITEYLFQKKIFFKGDPLLQYDREKSEQLKYLRNVYCVMANYSKDQDMRTSHKATN